MDYVVGSVAALISGNVTPNRPKLLKRALTPTKHQPSPNVTPKSEFVDNRSIFLSPTLQKKKEVAKKSPKRIFQNPDLDETNEDGETTSPKADKVKKHLKNDLDAPMANSSTKSPKKGKNKLNKSVELESPKKNKMVPDSIEQIVNNLNNQVNNENTPKKKKKRQSISVTEEEKSDKENVTNEEKSEEGTSSKKSKKKRKSENSITVTENTEITANNEEQTTPKKKKQKKNLQEENQVSNNEIEEAAVKNKIESKKKKNKKNKNKQKSQNQTENEESPKKKKKEIVNPNAITTKDSDSEHESDNEIESETEKNNDEIFNKNQVEESSDEEEEEVKNQPKKDKKERNQESSEDEVKRTIFVGNVPFSKKCKKEIKKIFLKHGNIETIRIRTVPVKDARFTPKLAVIKDELHPDRSTVNVYVKFKDAASVEKALTENNTVLNESHLRVTRTSDSGAHDSNRAIFVGNLPFAIEDDALRAIFEKCGEIDSVRIIRDRKTNAGKGFGYVNFTSKDGVELALSMTEEDLTIKNRIIRVKRCTHTNKQKQGGSERKDVKRPTKPGIEGEGAFRRIMKKRQHQESSGGPPNKRGRITQPSREKKTRKEFVGMTAAAKKKKPKFTKGQKKKRILSEILTKSKE